MQLEGAAAAPATEAQDSVGNSQNEMRDENSVVTQHFFGKLRQFRSFNRSEIIVRSSLQLEHN